MATPEGRVKDRVRKVLAEYPGMYSYWPVPTGFGKTTLDVICCYRGQFFTIETKAAGKKPTARQMEEIHNIEAAMGKSFIIAGEHSPVLTDLRVWLDFLKARVADAPHFTQDPVNRRTI